MSSSGPEVSFRLVDSPVGGLLLGASRAALQVLEFTDPQKVTARVAAARGAGQPHPILDQAEQELAEYFAGRRRKFEIPLAYDGSPFQRRVWAGLREIGYGETSSYIELARRIGDENSLRAVGQANGQNPIAIVIPCHRVINANGELGGFGGGALRKQYLLDLERGDRLL